MCGIVGFSGTCNSASLIAGKNALLHRGPDGSGIFQDEKHGIGLGHTRLSIIDLSTNGHQPMQTEDGSVVITYNGEIYNFQELRQELSAKGFSFRGHSDTEVLLNLYVDRGEAMLSKLNGIFAFAIWDSRRKNLFIARDGMGVKPLYYSSSDKIFAFASEIKALHHLVPDQKELDPKAIHRYLSFLWCPGAGTPLKSIRKMLPGEAMIVHENEIKRRWTWYRSPTIENRTSSLDSVEAIDGVRTYLRQAVQRQMVADVPVGAFLSGGLDSSSIAAFAHQFNPDIRCFTIQAEGGGDAGEIEDLPFAQKAASHLGLRLEVVNIDPVRMANDIENMIYTLDEPLADPASLNVKYISQLARSNGMKVLLSGAGGDDLFTGYRRHQALQFDALWDWIPKSLTHSMAKRIALLSKKGAVGRRLNRLFSHAMEESDTRLAGYFAWARESDLRALYSPYFLAELEGAFANQPLIEYLAEMPEGLSKLQKILALEQRFFLADHNLIYTDKMSMAAGVEVRVPFLDPDLVDFASTIPNRFKQRGLTGKWVLKKAMEPFLPQEIIYRSKTGFGAPLRRWLRHELRDMLNDFLSPQSLQNRGLFNPTMVQKLIADNQSGRVDAAYTLFSILCVEIWCRRFVDNPISATPAYGNTLLRQILQNLSNGETLLAEVPCPQNRDGNLLIASRRSLVSAGTERMLVDFGKANFIDKARQQPDKVKQVLDKVKTDGLFTTIDAVRSKLDQPIPLGYCNAGVVLESGADGFKKGDRVVSNGHHAQVVRVAKNLCAKIPDQVDDDTAAFTVLAAIGLQGIRLIKPTLGETIIVSGLGLIGLMCVQMLRANGCRVLGIDYSKERCELASKFGAQTVNLSLGQDPIAAAQSFSRGRGVDGVIIAASAKNNDVIHQAATMCRKRGRIVLIGVVGLNLRRDDFFEKEITFQVSASYGPGRYDPHYEEKGHDYPVGFVRWTEQRNFEAVLDMMATGDLDVKPLISHRFSIDEALQAYELVSDKSALGILIEYPQSTEQILRQSEINLGIRQDHATNPIQKQTPVLGFIGAGNYASRILIPAFKATGASLEMLASSGGVSGVYHGKKAGFASTTTQLVRLWDNKKINTIVIATRHDEHASQVVEALKSGKNVFVEKPLALTRNELEEIKNAYLSSSSDHLSPLLMVGFNRRFAPHIVKMKSLLEIKREPKSIVITVNAGAIPSNHWTQDLSIGGGRIIGECCHFIDLMRYLVGHPIERHQAMMIGNVPGIDVREDKVTINLSFSDGSFGSIHYLANGGKSFPKERIEVFCGDAVLQMNNYRNLEGFGWQGFKSMKLWSQDKGQKACAQAFIDAISAGSVAPISFDEIIESSGVTIDIAQSLR